MLAFLQAFGEKAFFSTDNHFHIPECPVLLIEEINVFIDALQFVHFLGTGSFIVGRGGEREVLTSLGFCPSYAF